MLAYDDIDDALKELVGEKSLVDVITDGEILAETEAVDTNQFQKEYTRLIKKRINSAVAYHKVAKDVSDSFSADLLTDMSRKYILLAGKLVSNSKNDKFMKKLFTSSYVFDLDPNFKYTRSFPYKEALTKENPEASIGDFFVMAILQEAFETNTKNGSYVFSEAKHNFVVVTETMRLYKNYDCNRNYSNDMFSQCWNLRHYIFHEFLDIIYTFKNGRYGFKTFSNEVIDLMCIITILLSRIDSKYIRLVQPIKSNHIKVKTLKKYRKCFFELYTQLIKTILKNASYRYDYKNQVDDKFKNVIPTPYKRQNIIFNNDFDFDQILKVALKTYMILCKDLKHKNATIEDYILNNKENAVMLVTNINIKEHKVSTNKE